MITNFSVELFADECDGKLDCTDGSDEFGSCDDDKFTCDCLINKTCNKCSGCINKTLAVEKGLIQCPDVRITYSRFGKINIYSMKNKSECDEIGFPQCDNSTCYKFNYLSSRNNKHTEVNYLLCTSFCSNQKYCHKKPAFHCLNDSYIFLDHFCDGVVDCVDGSDEIVNEPGFKCNECVLPQNNLYDDLAQCDDNSDLCLFENNGSCFECLDKRLLISSKQVCDGVNDCYDLSDECLCDDSINAQKCVSLFEEKKNSCSENKSMKFLHQTLKVDIQSIQSGKKTITCPTKFGFIQALPCDERPECKNFEDECECNNPPPFCSDSCRSFFPMGDRYCDGVEDPAWKYLNKTQCPKGFDELECPKRFKCNATGNISIDVLQICDGKLDCDDGSDESNCSGKENDAIFSSDTEMIAKPGFKAAFWIMGIIILFGNACIVADTVKYLKKHAELDVFVFQRIIVLNISIADFIMGVYLITIATYSQVFSGIYGSVDGEWRSSLRCSVVGSLCVISSEASCLSMVVLTAFRLKNICKPMTSLASSLLPWKLCIVATWLLSICLSVIPIVGVAPSYFIHSISFSSRFHKDGSIGVAQLKQFMCRYALLSNTTVKNYGNELESIEMFLKTNLPNSLPMQMFGYYGETSICMPRFSGASEQPSWKYTLSLITVNFMCFIFITVSYVTIYQLSNKSLPNEYSSRSVQEAAKMQKRISQIIVTNFSCWIPICFMVYVRLEFSKIVYQISAVFLLPINSALNPFLYSSLSDKLLKFKFRKVASLED